ncbi:GlcG/HbpS family heme-binding protein [Aquariibacter albus]|uniref:Heme-binding protein n=1 Tax=Aquariibacter albus TaxID=2759899 RepID=A0A839HEY7_9BURK|nr:heme-binding protein [Aquariibacter albus]MBB1160407.1 heme-binding protein [Aquariibacter albus]
MPTSSPEPRRLAARSAAASLLALTLGLSAAPGGAAEAAATFGTTSLTPETALRAAQAALESCRKAGYQTGVAVVDRSGVLQAFVRDRFAGAHTVEVAANKAWTAASFKIPTMALATETQAGKSMSGIRTAHARVAALGGGLPIEAGGSLVGAIGVSGAPGGEADEACARAGLKAIEDALAF